MLSCHLLLLAEVLVLVELGYLAVYVFIPWGRGWGRGFAMEMTRRCWWEEWPWKFMRCDDMIATTRLSLDHPELKVPVSDHGILLQMYVVSDVSGVVGRAKGPKRNT